MGAFVPLWCGNRGERANGQRRASWGRSRGACALMVWRCCVALRFVWRLNGLWLWGVVSVMRCADALTVGEGARRTDEGGGGVPTPIG